MNRLFPVTRWFLVSLLLSMPLHAEVTTGEEPETGLRYWQWQGDGALFRITQRLPDQTRAFFLGRGFDQAGANLIANRCVFQSMFKNVDNNHPIEIDLTTWKIKTDQGVKKLLVREQWQQELQGMKVNRAARIALEWSLLPTTQHYEVEDYNWGMTSYGLPPGSQFDLAFSWKKGEELYSGILQDIECAPDNHPEVLQ